MGNLFINWAAALISVLVLGSNVSTTAPIVTISASPKTSQTINVMSLPEAPTASPETIKAYTEISNPAPVSKTFNTDIDWKLEPAISLKQAITNSQISVKNFKKLCKDPDEFLCTPNPLKVINPDYGLAFDYEDKFLIVWYSAFANQDQLNQAKTFIAEFDSLEQETELASSIYSAKIPLLPIDQYSDLKLLNLKAISYSYNGGQGCISSGCGNNGYLVKDHQVIAIDKEAIIAGGRYGGGTKCIVIRAQAILLCNTQDWHTKIQTQEAFWLK